MDVSQPDLTEIVAKFEEKGLRWTVQRQLVLQTVQHYEGHRSADEIHNEVIKLFPSVNRSTVYRTLEVLSDLGVIVEMEGHGNTRVYQLARFTQHYHAWCENCGIEIEVNADLINLIKAQIQKQFHLRLNIGHFVGWKLCTECAKPDLAHDSVN
jgi:Fur family ferric uptake transcriptional regulator